MTHQTRKLESLQADRRKDEEMLVSYNDPRAKGRALGDVRMYLVSSIERIDTEVDIICEEIYRGFQRHLKFLQERKLNLCFFGERNKEKRLKAINTRIEAIQHYTYEFIRSAPVSTCKTLARADNISINC